MSGNAVVRRRRNVRSEQSIRKLVDAAIDELGESTYAELTVRAVAARASVSPTTAYTYFPSKDALIAEVYLRVLREAAVFTDVNDTAETRVTAQLRELALLIADRPNLADACTIALMADDAVVNTTRLQIAAEVSRRIKAALGPGYPASVASTLHMLFSGALVHARSSAGGYALAAEHLGEAVPLILHAHTATARQSG